MSPSAAPKLRFATMVRAGMTPDAIDEKSTGLSCVPPVPVAM
jgi:hypothetical protein